MLNLPQILFLLAIDDDRGMVIAAPSLRYGLKAAVLADLTLLEKIGLDEHKKLRVLDGDLIGDEILDKELGKICASRYPRKISSWMYGLGQKKLRKQIADSLISNGILIPDGKAFQWVIPYAADPQREASAKYWIKTQLRDMLLAGAKPEPWMVTSLSVLRACRLLNLIFTKDERKAASKKVETLVRSGIFKEPIAQELEDITSATAEAAFASSSG
jgi:hypothetical protein